MAADFTMKIALLDLRGLRNLEPFSLQCRKQAQIKWHR
jgi:hypothetical protein